MERNNLIKKGLTVAVIVLFIGLAFAPSINANIGKSSLDSELVEITMDVCGIDGIESHNVTITQEQLDKVDILFDSLKNQLNESKNMDETRNIFNETVVELDNIVGLPNNMTIEEAQRLVNGGFHNPKILKILEIIEKRSSYEPDHTNYFCLMAGGSTHTIMAGPVSLITSMISSFFYKLSLYFPGYAAIWEALSFFFFACSMVPTHISVFNLIGIGSGLCFGSAALYDTAPLYPAQGWMFIMGLTGGDLWIDHDFLGQLWDTAFAIWPVFNSAYFLGAGGFTGLTIGLGLLGKKYYIGAALAAGFDLRESYPS